MMLLLITLLIAASWIFYFIAKKQIEQKRKRTEQKLLGDLEFSKRKFDEREWRYKIRGGAINVAPPPKMDFFKMMMDDKIMQPDVDYFFEYRSNIDEMALIDTPDRDECPLCKNNDHMNICPYDKEVHDKTTYCHCCDEHRQYCRDSI